MTRSPSVNAFTLVELLTVITITAILVTVAVFYTAGYVAFAKHTSDQQTLAVFNDALNRYKCDGGDVNALTASAPIANVLAKLQAPIHWAGGLTHQVMQAGVTYPARSLTALGDNKQYHFTRYNTATTNDTAGVGGSSGGGDSLGAGVGYMANDGSASYNFSCSTTSGYFAVKDSSNNVTEYGSSSGALVAGSNPSLTFWSCTGAADPTPSGDITGFDCRGNWGMTSNQPLTPVYIAGFGLVQRYHSIGSGGGPMNHLTALDVSHLTNLQTFYCSGTHITALDFHGFTSLDSITATDNQLTTLDIGGCANLQTLRCSGNQLTSLNVSGLTNLQTLYCGGNQLASVDITGDTSLPEQSTTDTWATNFVTDPGVTVIGP